MLFLKTSVFVFSKWAYVVVLQHTKDKNTNSEYIERVLSDYTICKYMSNLDGFLSVCQQKDPNHESQ